MQLRSESDVRSVRSDDAGRYRIAGLSPGEYRVSVLRIGYAEAARALRLGDRDETLNISLLLVPRALGEIQVRGDISAIYGRVGRLPDLLPIRGAKVQVLGANATSSVDSLGAFFMPVSKPGTYLVRITAEGFAEQRFSIVVPDGRAVDASRLLDPSQQAAHPALEHLFAAANERIRARGYNSAVVTGSEVRAGGNDLYDGLQRSPAFAKRGLRFGPSVCVYVNGRGTGVPLLGINVDEVEAVEVYGGNRADPTATLAQVSTNCSPIPRPIGPRSGVARSPEIVTKIIVWMKP